MDVERIDKIRRHAVETPSRQIRRRYFLKSGAISGFMFSLVRLKNIGSISFSESRRNNRCRNSGDFAERLRDIASKYGSELGNLKRGF